MGRTSVLSKISIKGTRAGDDIMVTSSGVLLNGGLREFSEAQIERGFILNGAEGDDTIRGGPGPDELLGGAGNDRLIGTGADRFDGGRGIDWLDLSGSPVAMAVDLQGLGAFADVTITSDPNSFLFAEMGEFTNGVAAAIENIIATAYSDFVMGNALANIIHGGDGNDILVSGARNDAGADQLFGGAGNDELYASNGSDILTGGTGNDTFGFDPNSYDGNWVVMDYTPGEDRAYAFPYSGDISWSTVDYQGRPSAMATFADGDTVIFYNVAQDQVDLAATMSWPGG